MILDFTKLLPCLPEDQHKYFIDEAGYVWTKDYRPAKEYRDKQVVTGITFYDNDRGCVVGTRYIDYYINYEGKVFRDFGGDNLVDISDINPQITWSIT
jgi:hypothetical protein